MVITHLVLNDMIKVKGQISHIAMALVDFEESIRDLSRLFFMKLSERSNNPLYNLLGDIISNLSNVPQEETTTTTAAVLKKSLSSEQFQTIMHFLLSFIQKDKYVKSFSFSVEY
jgi:condensin complex subunit 1